MWADMVKNNEDFIEEFFRVNGDNNIPKANNFIPEIMDNSYLRMELVLQRDGMEPAFARVTKRMQDENGNPIEQAHQHPILDTRMFEVEFLDGTRHAMTANKIVENLFAQEDQEGHRLMLIDEIVDYRSSNETVAQADAFVRSNKGRKKMNQNTKGWGLLI